MLSLGLLGPSLSDYGALALFGAFCGSCMTNLWHIVWFRRDWYRPVEDDASCYLVDTFAPAFLLLYCTSVGAMRAKRRRDSTACFWMMLDGAEAHRRVLSLLIPADRQCGTKRVVLD